MIECPVIATRWWYLEYCWWHWHPMKPQMEKIGPTTTVSVMGFVLLAIGMSAAGILIGRADYIASYSELSVLYNTSFY